VAAQEEDQQYKVGKYILETQRTVNGADWEGEEYDGKAERKEEVLFDSQDEDECEDLFMGVWSEKLAMKRKREKRWKTFN